MKVQIQLSGPDGKLPDPDYEELDQDPEPRGLLDTKLLQRYDLSGAETRNVLGGAVATFPLRQRILTAHSLEEIQQILKKNQADCAPAHQPDISVVGDTLKFGAATVGVADHLLQSWVPAAHAGGELPLQLTSVFLSAGSAAISVQDHGLSWKSAPAIGSAALDLFSLVGTMYPPLERYASTAKVVSLGLKWVSAGNKLAEGRLFVTQST